jgi:hypothetical protein
VLFPTLFQNDQCETSTEFYDNDAATATAVILQALSKMCR